MISIVTIFLLSGGFVGFGASAAAAIAGDDLFVVDCLLPGQVRKLGRKAVYLTQRRPIKTTATDCEIRGGEYVAYDRANYATALKVWLPLAESGDAMAQTFVGEIYQKGLGIAPAYQAAAKWYRKAAEAGSTRAQINLGHLYEKGLGVERDPVQAINWYRKAAGLPGGVTLDPGSLNPRAEDSATDTEEVDEPTIEIIKPPLMRTRGEPRIKLRSGRTVQELVFKDTAPKGRRPLYVNGKTVLPDNSGVYQTTIPINLEGTTPVTIASDGENGKRVLRKFVIFSENVEETPPSRTQSLPDNVYRGIQFGGYYALVVGNDEYPYLPNLETAVADAIAVADLLRDKYGFQTKTLINATRHEILTELYILSQQVKDTDNLLIYYAGHGELDEVNDKGHWLPIDADPENPAQWLSNVRVTDYLTFISATQILLVIDSCYPGSLTRSGLIRTYDDAPQDERVEMINILVNKRSRTALTSGGVQPVLDSIGGEHSVFAEAFLEVLRDNKDVLEGERLHRLVRAQVITDAATVEFKQTPEYAPIAYAGHEAGDFLFVPTS